MTYEQLIGDLKNKVYKPVYFLWGEEPYYIDLVTSFIAGNVLSEAEQSFNQTILYGKDSEAGQVSDLAQTLSHDGLSPGGDPERGPGNEEF